MVAGSTPKLATNIIFTAI